MGNNIQPELLWHEHAVGFKSSRGTLRTWAHPWIQFLTCPWPGTCFCFPFLQCWKELPVHLACVPCLQVLGNCRFTVDLLLWWGSRFSSSIVNTTQREKVNVIGFNLPAWYGYVLYTNCLKNTPNWNRMFRWEKKPDLLAWIITSFVRQRCPTELIHYFCFTTTGTLATCGEELLLPENREERAGNSGTHYYYKQH